MSQEKKVDQVTYSTLIGTSSSEAGKCSLGMDCLQKAILYGFEKLDNRFSEMYKIFDKIVKFIMEAIKNRKMKLKAGGKTLTEVKIQTDF